MLHRYAAVAGLCMLVPLGLSPLALADPPADPPAVPVADNALPPPPPGGPAGPVPSGAPGRVDDAGRLGAECVRQGTSPWSRWPPSRVRRHRESTWWTAHSTARSPALGRPNWPAESLEAGYQIGCGITQDDIESVTSAGITPGLNIPCRGGLFPITLTPSFNQQIKIDLKPGTVNIVPVGKKSFKGTNPRVSITGFRIKIDGCAGQSFIRSYATLTSSTDNTDDVVTYLGVTKVV